MDVSQVLHMTEGEGEFSYFTNSLFQKRGILKAKSILEESITELCNKSLGECITMAEIGCSCGPNSLLPLWGIIHTIDSIYSKINKKPPIMQVFLNDLPGNDFNTLFRSIVPNFQQKLEKEKEKGKGFGPCFIGAMPGSFHGRLFPPNSLQFVHSSYSLHWLSQVPQGLVSESGIPLNKENICVAKTSLPSVQKAYTQQFEMDFTKFLRSRAVEVVAGGGMVLSFLAKNNRIPGCEFGVGIYHFLGTSLYEMVQEGLIEESSLDSFNIPIHAPSAEEVTNLIEREGSFAIGRVEEFQLSYDANIEDGNKDLVFDKWERGKYVANYVRATVESLLATHFGDDIIEDVFHKLSIKYADALEKRIAFINTLVISMTKK